MASVESERVITKVSNEIMSINSQPEINPYYIKNEISSSLDEDELEEQNLKLEKIESIKTIVDKIPDKFSGWGLTSVIGCAIFNFNTWGANSAYSLYLQEYLRDNTFEGATKYSFAIIGGLTFSSGIILAPLINYLIGRIGLKVTIGIGIIVYFVAIMLASFSTKLWQLYCTQGVMSGIGMGLICVANVNIVPQWFKGGPGGKRNLAMGIQACGSGIGGIIYNIGMESLLKRRTFRWSLKAQAIMCLGLNVISLCLIKSRNNKIKPVFKVYDKKVWTNFGCICLIFWIMFTQLGYVVLLYNLGDFTRSLGYSSEQASVVGTMVSVGIIYGRPIVGKIGDVIGPVNVTIAASWLVALFSLAMWIPCRNYATAIVFAMFVGSLMGTIWLTMATMNAAIIGLKKYGIAMSISWIACGIFGFVSPIIGIALKKNGPQSPLQYQPASIFVGLSYFMAGVILVFVRGWLIARNSKVNDELETEDDVIEIKVSMKETIKNMLAYQKV
jgi:MFS family permease